MGNGCEDTSDCYHIFVLGLDNASSLVAQVIYNDKKLIIKTTTIITGVKLAIYDLSRRMVSSNNYGLGNIFIIDLDHLPAGNYIIKLISSQAFFAQMFIKY